MKVWTKLRLGWIDFRIGSIDDNLKDRKKHILSFERALNRCDELEKIIRDQPDKRRVARIELNHLRRITLEDLPEVRRIIGRLEARRTRLVGKKQALQAQVPA